jgi:ankyrin repeat protein
VKLLIDVGADVNAQSKDGWTALMVAARYRSADFVEVLLGAGANIATVNHEGMTAFDLAFQNDMLRNTEMQQKLRVH